MDRERQGLKGDMEAQPRRDGHDIFADFRQRARESTLMFMQDVNSRMSLIIDIRVRAFRPHARVTYGGCN